MKKAFLLYEPSWGIINRIPIRIIEIVEGDLFPVKYEYRQRGYKGLTFTTQKHKIELI